MKPFAQALGLVPILVLGLNAPAFSQLAPAPTPSLGLPGPCPAVARFDFDVSSIDGATRTRWQIWRAAPGQSFSAATQVDDGVELTTAGSVERDLRAFGRVLDGTRYFFRVAARIQGGINISAFSEPAIFELDVDAGGMFTAIAGSTPGSLRVNWNLTGPIGECADRVAIRVDKVGSGGSVAAQSVEAGASGTRPYDLTATGSGDYDVRLHARHGGDEPQDAVGREGVRANVTIALPPPNISIDDLSVPEGNGPNPQSVIVRLSAPASQPVSVLIGARPGGTATEGVCAGGRDFTFALRTVTIDPGQTELSVPFTLCGDTVLEPDETFTLGLLNPVNAVIGNAVAVITILNDDLTINISSFQLQGGAPSVRVGVPVTLDATITGPTPTQFKAAPCGAEFTAAPFQAFPATPPPTLPGFTTVGTRLVCYQVQSGLTNSTVVRDTIQVIEPLALDPGAEVRIAAPRISITSFQIRGGLPFVTVTRDVPLNITASGSPTEFRTSGESVHKDAATCEATVLSQSFEPFSPSAPPIAGMGHTGVGRRFVCVQVRAGTVTSAVAVDDIDVVPDSHESAFLGSREAISNLLGLESKLLDCFPKFAIGIFGQYGKFVDHLGLRCAELGPNGEHQNIGETRVFGGGGGDFGFEVDCPSGEVLFGFLGRSGEVIDQLTSLCIPWRSDIGSNGDASPSNVSVGGHSGDRFGPVTCPIPHAVTSIEVFKRVGLVGTFRFFCRTPPDM